MTFKHIFVCLFVWSLSSHSRIFHSYGDVIISGEGLQILACVLYSWPLSSEGSLACHSDTGHPFIMVLFCRAFSNGTVTTCFYDLVLWRLGFEHPTFRLPGKRSNPLCHRHGKTYFKCYSNMHAQYM